MTEPLRFVPSRVEGLPDVTEIAVSPDRLELKSAGEWVVRPFASMVKWPRPAWLWQALFRLGWRRRWGLAVADRDWFHRPPDRFFSFYTTPPLVVYMPNDEITEGYAETTFVRIQMVMRSGGFASNDLG